MPGKLLNQKMVISKTSFILICALAAMFALPVIITASYALYQIGQTAKEARNTIAQTHKAIDANEPVLRQTIDDLRQTSARAKEFSDNFLTSQRATQWDQYLRDQQAQALGATHNGRLLTASLQRLIEGHLMQTVDDFHSRANKEMDAVIDLTGEATHQIAQNGDAARELLDEGRTLIVKSELELLSMLSEIKATAHGLSVLTNDSELATLIRNSSDTAFHVEQISGDLAALSHHIIDPIVNPVKTHGINRYLFQPIIKVVRIVNGAGNIFFLVSKF